MKYSSQLLKRFISVNDTPENIARNLIVKTCEIEAVHERSIPETVVIGLVKSCEKHPEADKLSVCQLDCGKKGQFQILCGGVNVKAWLWVPVALPGTYLKKVDLKIEPRKMRGLDSNGMICSKEELGINEDLDAHTIRDLSQDLEELSEQDIWTPLVAKFPWLEWRALDVDSKSLTNRPDLTWHFGLAVELHAIYTADKISYAKIKEYMDQCSTSAILQTLDNSKAGKVKVVSKSEGLNSYLLLEINDIKINQTGFFTRLEMLDMDANPINNRVDFSNLFMLMSGQPVHFFDAEKVEGDIIVRNAKEGEEFIDLFETKHILKGEDIVITDKKKILALAWVIGGQESWITEDTKNILVEIANFDPVMVRKTWTRLGLRTDAELRFEKNINPRWTLFCLILFLDQLKYSKKDLWDFEIGGLNYFISNKVKDERKKMIELDRKKMTETIFGKMEDGFGLEAKKILQRLWCEVKEEKITPPLRRGPNDLNIPEDLYEEVARIYGYDQVEWLPLMSEMKNIAFTDEVLLQRKSEDVLVRNFACNQMETYPRVGEKILQAFHVDPKDLYSLANPTNPETPYLRDDMIYGLLAHTAKNCKFFDQFKIFDIGKIWNKKNKKSEPVNAFASSFVDEQMQLGVMLYQKSLAAWDQDPLLEAKNMVKSLCKEFGIQGEIIFAATGLNYFHPKKQAKIVVNIAGKEYGIWTISALHPVILQQEKVGENASVVYLSFTFGEIITCLNQQSGKNRGYETLQDQIVSRDLCFVVDMQKDFSDIVHAVKSVPEIEDVEVFDVYAGKNIWENKKSVSLRVKIVGRGGKENESMTTDQINAIMQVAIANAEKAGASLRG